MEISASDYKKLHLFMSSMLCIGAFVGLSTAIYSWLIHDISLYANEGFDTTMLFIILGFLWEMRYERRQAKT